jgi:hypothetical protein
MEACPCGNADAKKASHEGKWRLPSAGNFVEAF